MFLGGLMAILVRRAGLLVVELSGRRDCGGVIREALDSLERESVAVSIFGAFWGCSLEMEGGGAESWRCNIVAVSGWSEPYPTFETTSKGNKALSQRS